MEFAIPDMTCGGCAKAVSRAVTSQDPAATIEVDVPVKIVRVTSTLAPHRLIEAIEAAGFHPSLND
ncbi:heavy-metal-associated domain-containing protein [Paraburkholderia sp. BCC1884]|uniref:heavy-metal-associated domain-containing protein n=1 Tax=Paraburkholderia sp. BCC1884 TaxID=2562668 RepID=UPI001182E9E8|nr:heavy-metal-associated domain-containing protein [Paraburkholderia sp. BCC1884]